MKRTYRGSCHCGAVGFACEADLAAGTSRCNCSICAKGRFWKVVLPAADFRLLRGEDALAEYRFGGELGAGIRHCFCKTSASSRSAPARTKRSAENSTP